jgi:hypothetical protein
MLAMAAGLKEGAALALLGKLAPTAPVSGSGRSPAKHSDDLPKHCPGSLGGQIVLLPAIVVIRSSGGSGARAAARSRYAETETISGCERDRCREGTDGLT